VTHDILYDQLAGYVRREFLGDSTAPLDADSPLLEWGILNSMNTARLLTYIREEIGVTVPPTCITGTHFKNLGAVTALVRSLQVGTPEARATRD
jgi:acyl carrier protein